MNAITKGSPPLESGEAPRLLAQSETPNQNYSATRFCGQKAEPVKFQFPNPQYLPGRVLGVLLTGESLTHKDSWIRFGHARLADSIWKLRRIGWPVQCVEKDVQTSDAGRRALIGIYFLEPDAIDQTGERGQRYAQEAARIEAERRAA